MNLENIKQSGARQGLLDEAHIIMHRIEDAEAQRKWYECEQQTKDLQAIYAELLRLSTK